MRHEKKLLLYMITNLATIDISRNFLGQKIGVKNILQKSKENKNMKEQNQTTAIVIEQIQQKIAKFEWFEQEKVSDRNFADF